MRWSGKRIAGGLAGLALVAAALSIEIGTAQSGPATPPEESAGFGLPDQHSSEAVWWLESRKTEPGRLTIRGAAVGPFKCELFRLRSLELKPVR